MIRSKKKQDKILQLFNYSLKRDHVICELFHKLSKNRNNIARLTEYSSYLNLILNTKCNEPSENDNCIIDYFFRHEVLESSNFTY